MLSETVAGLLPASGRLYVDATLGGGGHSEALLEASAPEGRLVAFDRDPRALAAAQVRLARFGERVRFVHAPFSELRERLDDLGIGRV
ncbi:MAG TPA: 16S rRNA (cytosine(1402)-N(4))-methyltransferase, partial [Polyangiales bacterium]|nr:16S rRNA (cytosine(1402)-N(4))-methyltransferase [Polyangiales bacterium]